MNENILNDTGHGAPPVLKADAPPEGAPHLIKIAGVNTSSAVDAKEFVKHIDVNIEAKYPRFHELPEFNVPKNVPVVIVGGGPSLNSPQLQRELRELASKYPVIAAGSSHDWCQEHGITVNYCVVCDPDPVMVTYLNKPDRRTLYLLSTHVHPDVVKRLRGYNIAFWHCYTDGVAEHLDKVEPGYQAVGGGCTVGLRALNIAIVMGYYDLHLFGYDSCILDEDTHHAYPFNRPDEESLGDVYDLMIGYKDTPFSKPYKVAGYQLAQVDHFKSLLREHGDRFNPIFHGPGFLPDMYRMIAKETLKVRKEQTEVTQNGL